MREEGVGGLNKRQADQAIHLGCKRLFIVIYVDRPCCGCGEVCQIGLTDRPWELNESDLLAIKIEKELRLEQCKANLERIAPGGSITGP